MSETERFVHESIQDKRSIQQFLLTLVDGIETYRKKGNEIKISA